MPTKEARLAIADLVDNKQLEEVQIESWKEKAYIAPHISIPKSANGCSLVSPFDPIVWNRKRLDRLFDFQYKLEMYTPESKRRFGYYVLPLLIDDRFVGRFDIRNIRDKRTLHVKASFLEKGVEAGDIAQKAFDELARRWHPILDAFDEAGVDLCYEIHPGEDLHDGITFEMFLEKVGNHPRCNMLYDPSHFILQHLNYLDHIDIYHDKLKRNKQPHR